MVVEPLILRAVIVVVANVEVPVTDKVPPTPTLPEKVGLLATAIVLVPERDILLPALKKEIGLL
jgi:hypothetical protein